MKSAAVIVQPVPALPVVAREPIAGALVEGVALRELSEPRRL